MSNQDAIIEMYETLEANSVSFQEILDAVCKEFNVEESDVISLMIKHQILN